MGDIRDIRGFPPDKNDCLWQLPELTHWDVEEWWWEQRLLLNRLVGPFLVRSGGQGMPASAPTPAIEREYDTRTRDVQKSQIATNPIASASIGGKPNSNRAHLLSDPPTEPRTMNRQPDIEVGGHTSDLGGAETAPANAEPPDGMSDARATEDDSECHLPEANLRDAGPKPSPAVTTDGIAESEEKPAAVWEVLTNMPMEDEDYSTFTDGGHLTVWVEEREVRRSPGKGKLEPRHVDMLWAFFGSPGKWIMPEKTYGMKVNQGAAAKTRRELLNVIDPGGARNHELFEKSSTGYGKASKGWMFNPPDTFQYLIARRVRK